MNRNFVGCQTRLKYFASIYKVRIRNKKFACKIDELAIPKELELPASSSPVTLSFYTTIWRHNIFMAMVWVCSGARF